MSDGFDVGKEIEDANKRLAIDLSQQEMPLDIALRATALTIAQRHCCDITVKEGNLYQQLKMDNKLTGPLTIDHVIHCALIFERFLWGAWSKGIAQDAMTSTLDEVDEALKREFEEEPPTRPHGGGDTP